MCGKLGWVKGAAEALSDLSARKEAKETVKMMAQAAKEPIQLSEFLQVSLSRAPPSNATWVVIDELAKHK